MPRTECPQCEEHARLHAGNWLGLAPRKRCEPCEDHANNGCPDKRKKSSWW